MCAEAVSRFPPRRFRLAEFIPQPNFCQPWRKFVDKAESAVSWQLCFRTAVNVLDVFRTTNTSSSATKKFSFHAAFCLVSKANFTANPHPPRTLRAIETIPPIRDEHEGVAASGIVRRRTAKEETRFGSELTVCGGDKTKKIDRKRQEGGEQRHTSGGIQVIRSTQQVSEIRSVRQQTAIAKQSGNMDRDLSEDEDAGQLSIGEIRQQYEELLQGRVRAEETYAEMTQSAEMEAETRKRFEEGRGLREQTEGSEQEEEEPEEQLESVEISDDEPVSNEETTATTSRTYRGGILGEGGGKVPVRSDGGVESASSKVESFVEGGS